MEGKGRGGAHCLDSMSVDGTLYGLVSCSYSQILDDTMMFPIIITEIILV